MELVGGFMVMLSIVGFFLAVIWFVLPFVIFAIKGRVDRAIDQLESLDRRLAAIESRLAMLHHAAQVRQPEPVAEAPLPERGESAEHSS